MVRLRYGKYGIENEVRQHTGWVRQAGAIWGLDAAKCGEIALSLGTARVCGELYAGLNAERQTLEVGGAWLRSYPGP